MQSISTLSEIFCVLLPVFTEPSGKNFLRLAVGWILCPGRRTVTGIIPFADPEGVRQHDMYHRFFRAATWSVSLLFQLWARHLVKKLCPDLNVILQTDDTVFKKSGRKIEGAKYCRDAVRSTKKKIVYAWGLQLVPICIRVIPPWGGEPLSIPVNVRIYRKGGPTLLDLTEEMIEELAEWLPTKSFVLVGDGAYASLAGRGLTRTHVISRMRCDAAIYEMPPAKSGGRGRPRKKGKRLPTPRQMGKRAKTWKKVTTCERGRECSRLIYVRKVLWYNVNKHEPVFLVISRDPDGVEKDDYFFTTDLTMIPGGVISEYANRWAIEDTFRNLKQFLGAEEPQCWKGLGPERAVAFSMFLYGAVWLWFIQHGQCQVKLPNRPWYENKKAISFIDAIATLRMSLWQKYFSRHASDTPKSNKTKKVINLLISALAWAA